MYTPPCISTFLSREPTLIASCTSLDDVALSGELFINPVALRKAKIVYNFGLSECISVKRKNSLLGKQCLSLKS